MFLDDMDYTFNSFILKKQVPRILFYKDCVSFGLLYQGSGQLMVFQTTLPMHIMLLFFD